MGPLATLNDPCCIPPVVGLPRPYIDGDAGTIGRPRCCHRGEAIRGDLRGVDLALDGSIDAIQDLGEVGRGEPLPGGFQGGLLRWISLLAPSDWMCTCDRGLYFDHARYGIVNDQTHADLVAAFDARFADDPNLAAEYQEAVRTYSAWVNENGGIR